MPQTNDPAVVVVGASAGGVEALRDLVSAFPLDLEACVLVVLHIPPTGTSALPAILDRAGPLPARHAVEGDRLEQGRILVAPPNRHLVVADGAVTLSRGPQENGHRPAVDVLFRSAARAQGPGVVGVVLSGSLDDGAAGAVAVKQRGGTALVQDFDEALHDGMPRAAAAAAEIDAVLPVKKLAARVAELVRDRRTDAPPVSRLMNLEADMADLDPSAMHHHERPGDPSGFGCPDCHGALFEIHEGDMLRYRCRVGHAWSAESLVARQTVSMESALWMALRSLEEKAALNSELGVRAAAGGRDLTAMRFRESEQETLRAAELVRSLIDDLGEVPPKAPTPQ